MKLNDTQLDWIFDCPEHIPIYFPQLQSIQLRILSQNEHYKEYLPILKRTIKSLVLDYQNATLFSRIDHEILHEFVLNESSTILNELTIDGVCLSIDCEYFQTCQTLKCLTLSVEYQHHLFILLEYLPQLEYLNIAIREGKAGKYDYNYSKTKNLSLKLREIILSANDIHFTDLTLLLKQCQPTLEILRLRLKIDYIIDGTMLASLKQSLKELSFYFFCHSLDDSSHSEDEILSSFQSPVWLNDQFVMFFRNSYYHTCTIVSPPDHCRSFNCSLTNEFSKYRLNNRDQLLKMTKIKRIFLNDKEQSIYSKRFFRTLNSIFTRLRILEIGSNFHLIENDDDDENVSSTEDRKLSSVHTLIIVNNQNHHNVKRLLNLLPNLSRLVIDFDLLTAHIDDYYSIDKQDHNHRLEQILIHFKPNEHIQLDSLFKDRIKFIYTNAQILS